MSQLIRHHANSRVIAAGSPIVRISAQPRSDGVVTLSDFATTKQATAASQRVLDGAQMGLKQNPMTVERHTRMRKAQILHSDRLQFSLSSARGASGSDNTGRKVTG